MPTTVATPSGYGDGSVGALVQAIVLGGFLAGAGLLAITAGGVAGEERPESAGAGHAHANPPPGSQPVVVVDPEPALLVIVLVDSDREAAIYRNFAAAIREQAPRLPERFAVEAVVLRTAAEAAEFERASLEAEQIGSYEDLPDTYVLDLHEQ
ncbi:MAG: hypothetical protein R3C29_07995 [Dehalococcoidia bacterium]